MATIEISAMSRSLQGTGASRRLRATGKVPGIIYGGDEPARNVEFDHNGLFLQLRQEAFISVESSLDLRRTANRKITPPTVRD
jgi:large subunit ribosomal protein L25